MNEVNWGEVRSESTVTARARENTSLKFEGLGRNVDCAVPVMVDGP